MKPTIPDDIITLARLLEPYHREMLDDVFRTAKFVNAIPPVDEDEQDEYDGDTGDTDEQDDDDDGDNGTKNEFPWDEFNRLRREQADTAKAARLAQKDAKKARDRERKEAGQYDEILAEKDEEVSAAGARAEAAEYQLDQFQRRTLINSTAQRLHFKDPQDAVRFLDEDDTDDEVSTERALKRLAREKPYLIDARRASGAPIGGENGTNISLEDIKRMSQEEINARWEEVQQALSAGTG